MSGNEVVIVRSDGPVGRITLNRPDARNAINSLLGQQLELALRQLGGSPDVHVILIRGAGGNFSVGGDFRELEELRTRGPAALAPLYENFGRACAAIAELPVPVVAAVEGYAMAGGFELMQASDIALVRADAKLADNHANFGQVPGGGGSQRLPRLAGRQRALGHILSGDRLSGAQAAAWGLAYRSFPPDEFEAGVEQFVQGLAAKDGRALSAIKRLVYDGLRMPLQDGLAMEYATVVEHVCSAGAGDGIASFTRRAGTRGAGN